MYTCIWPMILESKSRTDEIIDKWYKTSCSLGNGIANRSKSPCHKHAL